MSPAPYSPADCKPIKLSPAEIANPVLVFHDLFDYAHLPQVREELWILIKTAASGTFHEMESAERATLFFFFEKLEKIVEAAHILHLQQKVTKPRKK